MPNWRKLILRAMLGALALTALAAVAAIAFSNDVMWRIAGTTSLGAVATLIMMKLSPMLDEPRTRWAGLVGSLGLLAEFLLFVLLIWEVHRWLPGGWDESEALGTAGILALATAAAMAFLRMLHAAEKRGAALVGLAVTGASFLIAAIAVWFPRGALTWSDFHRITGSLWGTAGSLAGLGLLAVAALIGAGDDRRHWRWAGVASSAAALCLVLPDIWAGRTRSENVVAPLVAAAFWVALAVPLLRLELKGEQRWLRVATLAAAAVSAGLWTALVWGLDAEVMVRAAASCSILTACGIMALAVLVRLNRRPGAQDLPRELRTVTLFCPRCAKKQTLALGAGACRACGLRIEVKAEQPSCAQCGYLLYGATADRCSECGAPVTTPAAAA